MDEDNIPEGAPPDQDERSWQKMTGDQGAFPAADKAADSERESRVLLFWERLSQMGLSDTLLRLGTHMLSIALVLLVVWVMREFYLRAQVTDSPRQAALAAVLPTPTPTEIAPELPPFADQAGVFFSGIPRFALVHTTLPTLPRTEVITYTVQTGDTIFGIAEKYGLKPETILWGNYYVLADNPDNLVPGEVLNILPVNGTYHRWSAGEGLNGVAQGYHVKPEDIINWPGNHLDVNLLGDLSHPNIEPGTWLVVPGGSREFVNWISPRITRDNPAVAAAIGSGSCGPISQGAVGIGAFIWPSANHYLSGFDYTPSTNHYGIDIAGHLGDAVWAADGGVVVYSGWNNFGYGNLVVIDHGNGWQTYYAHLETIYVGCGQSVAQGTPIGAIGSTGKSSGPHLHFEMRHDTYGHVNPWDFLP